MKIRCDRCKQHVEPGDDYVVDGVTRICMDCIEQYIFDHYAIVDLARELGMSVREAPEDKTEEQDKPLPGQMDMFGGVVGENA